MTGTLSSPAIEPAEVSWQQGNPVSAVFETSYYNPDLGVEVSEHAFLRHNRLAERFAQVGNHEHFVVAETGFGTALNFLATWRLWRQANPHPHACLHFISVERYPLTRDDLTRALSLLPGFSPLTDELIENYPPAVTGTHRLVLDGGRVRLTVCFGDVNHAWQNLQFGADAWFLDGFAPALNPQMWSQQVIATVSAHSRPGTSFVAATASAQVRERLSAVGFSVAQAPGFRNQQNLLAGEISAPERTGENQSTRPERIGVIGAGIAGCLLANNLTGRGFEVSLIDQANSVATEASGNRQGALYVKLGVDYNDQTELALSSLLFSQRFYKRFEKNGWHPTGLMQLAYNDSEADRQARFLLKNQYPPSVLKALSAEQATQIAGISISHGGLWFPDSGWLEPANICAQLAARHGITHCLGFSVASIEKDGLQWSLTSSTGETLSFDRIVLCSGPDTPELIPLKGQYRMKRIRGQITEVPAQRIKSPSVVVCGPGYINPAFGGSSLVGATFDLHNASAETTEQSDRENLTMLAGLLPDAMGQDDLAAIAGESRGRVAFRCTTHDYQPIVGPLKTPEGDPLDGVYLFTGLGSKGLTYSPLLAEYLGDLLSGQPPCLPENLMRRVETQRCHRPTDRQS